MMEREDALAMYREAVENTDSPEGAMPMLLYGAREKSVVMMLHITEPVVQSMLRSALARTIIEEGPAEHIIFMFEAWSTTHPSISAAIPTLEPGELQARAKAGEDIAEVVIGFGLHRSGKEWVAELPFRRKDGQVEWLPEKPGHHEGAVLNILRSAIRPNPFMHAN